MPATAAAARAMYAGPWRSTGLRERARDGEPVRPADVQPPDAEAEVARVVQAKEEEEHWQSARAPSPKATSATSDQNGSHPAQTSRSPTLPSGPQIAVRNRSMRSGGTPLSSARASAPTATEVEIRMRVEVRALARQRRLERVAVHAAGQPPQRGLEGEPDAVAEQRLVVPRALDGEQPSEDADPRHR